MKTATQNRKGAPDPRTIRFLFILGALAIAGFALRLVVSREIALNDPIVTSVPCSTGLYSPFYDAVFLPAVSFLFRFGPMSVGIAQSLCAVGLIWFAGLSAAEIRGRFAGLAAAFLAAFSTMPVLAVPYRTIDVTLAFWSVFLFYLTLRAFRKKRSLIWCSAGIVLACAVLTCRIAWCFLLPVLIAAWLASGKNGKNFAGTAAVFLFGLILPLLPFASRDAIPVGTELAVANNPESTPAGMTGSKTLHEWLERAKTIPVSERIIHWAKEEPGAFAELQFRKFLLFWDSRETGNGIDPANPGAKSPSLILAFVPTSFLLLLTVAALLFCARSLKRSQEHRLLFLFILLYAFGAALYGSARIRIPAAGLLCISSACALDAIRRGLRSGEWKRPLNLAALPVGICAVFLLYGFYQFYLEAPVMRMVRPNGTVLSPEQDETDVQDHGPVFFDNRDAIELKQDTVITKRIILPGGKTTETEAELTLELYAGQSDEIIFDINGEPRTVVIKDLPETESGHRLFYAEMDPVPVPGNGEFEIRVMKTRTGKTLLLTDVTRNYTRTAVNGKTVPAEACIRFTLESK